MTFDNLDFVIAEMDRLKEKEDWESLEKFALNYIAYEREVFFKAGGTEDEFDKLTQKIFLSCTLSSY